MTTPEQAFQATLIALATEYYNAYRNGLGQESPPAKDIQADLEEAMRYVLQVKARLALGRALGLDGILIAAIIGETPDLPPDCDAD